MEFSSDGGKVLFISSKILENGLGLMVLSISLNPNNQLKAVCDGYLLLFQEEEAGKVKESEGDILGAISLFLKGGLPGLAAECANNQPTYAFQVV